MDSVFKYLNGKSHTEGKPRNVRASAVNCIEEYAQSEMMDTLKTYGKDNGSYVQVAHVIQSFSKDELDPNNEDDIDKVNAVGVALAEEMYPNHESIVYTQIDGKGGQIHNHIVTCAVDFETGKSLRGNQRQWQTLSGVSDEILKRPEFDLKVLESQNEDHKTLAEIKLAEKGEYVWKDDLKKRISDVMKDNLVNDKASFYKALQEKGVEARERGKGVSFAFVDENDKQRKARSSKLGTQYGKAQIEQSLKQSVAERTDKYDLDALLAQAQTSPVTPADEIDLNDALRQGKAIEETRAKEQAQAREEALRGSQSVLEAVTPKYKRKPVEEPETVEEEPQHPKEKDPLDDVEDLSNWNQVLMNRSARKNAKPVKQHDTENDLEP